MLSDVFAIMKSRMLLRPLLLGLPLLTGCMMYTTRGLVKLSEKGHHCTGFQHLEAAYLDRDNLIFAYTDGQSDYWALAPIPLIHQRMRAGLVMQYSYKVHSGSLPASITANARELSIVRIKPAARPPEFHPEQSELTVAIFDEGRSYWLGLSTGGTNSEVYSVGSLLSD